MGTTSDDYERFIAELIHNLEGTHRRITSLGYGRFNSIRGISGQDHQIDVSFIDNDFPSPKLVAIECKRLNKPIDLEHVKIVKATLDDILASGLTPDHAISLIVTTVGAREGARRYADYYGIRIEQVPHGQNFTFRYENVIQAGIMTTIKFSDTATVVVSRRCQSCGQSFQVERNEAVCPTCSQLG